MQSVGLSVLSIGHIETRRLLDQPIRVIEALNLPEEKHG
jgi:hypothetical protein